MVAWPRPIDVLNRVVGSAGVRVTRGLAFGENARQALDIYYPARRRGALPLLVFFYGGSWQEGARADYAFIGNLLVRRGFVVAVADYRLFPEARFPAFLEDCAAATQYVLDHGADYGGDTKTVFLMGHSAGAYNALMLALHPDYAALAERLTGVIGLAGPYDFLPLKDPAYQAIFSPPADIRDTQPITFAHGDAPALFLATGGADVTVLPRNTAALAAKLRQLGAAVETRVYPKLSHVGIVLSLLPWFRWQAPVLRDVLDFCAACRAGAFFAPHSERSSTVIG
jgi:acetyl esterase/lipase